jgi:hypothetical protein
MTTENRIIEAWRTSGRRRPCNRVALIIAATLHDAATKRGGTNHHLGPDAQAICRRVRDSILKRREWGRDVYNLRLE